jgi:lysozyme family protein
MRGWHYWRNDPIWQKLDALAPHTRGVVYESLREDVVDFYWRNFYAQSGADKLPRPLNAVIFDDAMNRNHPWPKRMLQRYLGVRVDGAIGPKTLSALRVHTRRRGGLREVCNEMLRGRVRAFRSSMRRDPAKRSNEGGWWNRSLAVQELIADHTDPR